MFALPTLDSITAEAALPNGAEGLKVFADRIDRYIKTYRESIHVLDVPTLEKTAVNARFLAGVFDTISTTYHDGIPENLDFRKTIFEIVTLVNRMGSPSGAMGSMSIMIVDGISKSLDEAILHYHNAMTSPTKKWAWFWPQRRLG